MEILSLPENEPFITGIEESIPVGGINLVHT